MSRTQNAIKNSIWGVVSKIIALLLSFVSRTVFIYYLGTVYLGVNGVYTELLNMLSLAELGFGTALNFALYKPIAEDDKDKIVQLLNFYKRIYLIIVMVITVIGFALLPVLPYILKGADALTVSKLRLYYVIFLANTVTAYFVKYKYSYVNACQKDYITTNLDTIINFVVVVAQVIIIILTKNFLAYLLVHTGILIFSKVFLSIYLNRKFPILREKSRQALDQQSKQVVYKEVRGLFIHQFSSLAIHSTDNLIISSLSGLGVVAVGLISNYNMLINSVLGFVTIIFASTISGFGNIVASGEMRRYRKTFLELNFLNFWVYGFCAIAFFVLVPPFIELWLGKSFLVDNISFFLIIVNCYLQGQSTIYNNARIAKGNFNKDKWLSFSQALINLVVSIICAHYWGLVGVYIGTIVSRLVFSIGRPILTYRFMMEKSPKEYFMRFSIYLVVATIAGILTWSLCHLVFKQITIITFMIACAIVLVIPNIFFVLCFYKSLEFKGLIDRLMQILKRKKKGKND